MNCWLVKSEPSTYSWHDFVKKGRDHWDGVRNYQARNHLKAMQPGDLVLFYHSVKEKAVVGIAKVVSESYPDPTTTDERWVVVDMEPIKPLSGKVSLEQIKAEPILAEISLLKQSRLSVMPLSEVAFNKIVDLSKAKN